MASLGFMPSVFSRSWTITEVQGRSYIKLVPGAKDLKSRQEWIGDIAHEIGKLTWR